MNTDFLKLTAAADWSCGSDLPATLGPDHVLSTMLRAGYESFIGAKAMRTKCGRGYPNSVDTTQTWPYNRSDFESRLDKTGKSGYESPFATGAFRSA